MESSKADQDNTQQLMEAMQINADQRNDDTENNEPKHYQSVPERGQLPLQQQKPTPTVKSINSNDDNYYF